MAFLQTCLYSHGRNLEKNSADTNFIWWCTNPNITPHANSQVTVNTYNKHNERPVTNQGMTLVNSTIPQIYITSGPAIIETILGGRGRGKLKQIFEVLHVHIDLLPLYPIQTVFYAIHESQ